MSKYIAGIFIVIAIALATLYIVHPRIIINEVEIPKYITTVSKPSPPDTVYIHSGNNHNISMKTFKLPLLYDNKSYGMVESNIVVESVGPIISIQDSIITHIDIDIINKRLQTGKYHKGLKTGIIIGVSATILMAFTILTASR